MPLFKSYYYYYHEYLFSSCKSGCSLVMYDQITVFIFFSSLYFFWSLARLLDFYVYILLFLVGCSLYLDFIFFMLEALFFYCFLSYDRLCLLLLLQQIHENKKKKRGNWWFQTNGSSMPKLKSTPDNMKWTLNSMNYNKMS